MQLTGRQIINREIITGACEEGIQQQGVDVRVAEIYHIIGSGRIPVKGKTKLPKTQKFSEFDWTEDENGVQYATLGKGYYEVELMEGCAIPEDCVLNFKTRSSLVRCGAEVRSGQFDAGFATDHMGCFLKVERDIDIERGARIAQAIVTESYPVEETDMYSGQFQGDAQRS